MNCINGTCTTAISYATNGAYMSCDSFNYAWAGLNFLLYAFGSALLLGILIAIGYAAQDWMNSASARRAEFINSISSKTEAAKPSRR